MKNKFFWPLPTIHFLLRFLLSNLGIYQKIENEFASFTYSFPAH